MTLIDVQIKFWDPVWKEISDKQFDLLIKGASAVLLFYDASEPKTFNNLDIWVKRVKETGEIGRSIFHGALIGTKSDLGNKIDRVIIDKKIEEWRDQLKIDIQSYEVTYKPITENQHPNSITNIFIETIIKKHFPDRENERLMFKVSLIGENGTGKTTFARIVTGTFPGTLSETEVGFDFFVKTIQIKI